MPLHKDRIPSQPTPVSKIKGKPASKTPSKPPSPPDYITSKRG